MRMQALSIHTSTEQPKDADWAHIVLDFLKAYVVDMGAELLMDVDDQKAYVTGLIETLRHAASELQAGRSVHLCILSNHIERPHSLPARHAVYGPPCVIRYGLGERSTIGA